MSDLDPTNPDHRRVAQVRNEMAAARVPPIYRHWEKGLITLEELIEKLASINAEILSVTQVENLPGNGQVPYGAFGFRLN